jgi:hypothetical protein
MDRACLIIFLPLFFVLSCHSDKANNQPINKTWVKVPDSWISRALHFKYGKVDTTLLHEFANFIKPDTLNNPKTEHIDPNYGLIFNCISVDLDGDQQDELVCLVGWDVYDPYLGVLKQINGTWYLIYREEIHTFYSSSTIYIANNYSSKKTFYLNRVYDHGSGVYINGSSFYKLVNNQVYKCLDIVNDAHIYGWGLFINQSIKSSFEFTGDSNDELSVNYVYDFFPGSILPSDYSWDSHKDTPLINGEETVDYIYDDKVHKYKLDVPRYENTATDLTAEKIACFGDFGDDSLFVKAYQRQIDTIIKIGTPFQKKLLRKYLSLAQKSTTIRTEVLEEKGSAGSTTFYGPKK